MHNIGGRRDIKITHQLERCIRIKGIDAYVQLFFIIGTLPGDVEIVINNGIVTYLVRVVIDNSSGSQIREGMTAFINFITAGVENVLTAPVDAVRNVDGKPSVESVNGGWVPVTTGFTDGKYVEIISGLNVGDKIFY